VHPLSIPVKRLREGPLEVEVELPPAELELADREFGEFEFRGPVRGRIMYHLVGQDVVASGELAVAVATRCVRCLTPVEVPVRATVNEVWMPFDAEDAAHLEDAAGEGAIVQSYRDDLIEPADVYRELLMVELPEHPCCSPDCRGLCPGCGADLNREACRCRAGEAPRSAAAELDWKRKLKNIKL